jgi:hypothetical protein
MSFLSSERVAPDPPWLAEPGPTLRCPYDDPATWRELSAGSGSAGSRRSGCYCNPVSVLTAFGQTARLSGDNSYILEADLSRNCEEYTLDVDE